MLVKMRSKMCLLGFVLGAFLMLVGPASAQSTQQITGRVTDPAGASLGRRWGIVDQGNGNAQGYYHHSNKRPENDL